MSLSKCEVPGKRNAVEARRTLTEFGELFGIALRAVRFATIEAYVGRLHERGNAQPTINKKLRYLRAAFNRAVKRQYIGANPMDGWQWQRENQSPPRIVADSEETKLLDTAEALFGTRMRAFVFVALNTGGRRSELLALTWNLAELEVENPRVRFSETKGKRDRFVPLTAETIASLARLRLNIEAVKAGGPFAGMGDNLGRRWGRIRQEAELLDVRIHSLRATYITRLIRAGVPLPTVQKLAGHADIKTKLSYDNWVSEEDLRAARVG